MYTNQERLSNIKLIVANNKIAAYDCQYCQELGFYQLRWVDGKGKSISCEVSDNGEVLDYCVHISSLGGSGYYPFNPANKKEIVDARINELLSTNKELR